MSHFIPEPMHFSEVTRLPVCVKKAWLITTLKDIKNLTNNQTFLIDYPEKGYPVTSCMDVYKANIKYDGSIYKLKLIIVVRGDLHNKEMIGDTWSPKVSMRILKYSLAYVDKNKAIAHQLDFIGAFLQDNVKHRVFVNFDSRYG